MKYDYKQVANIFSENGCVLLDKEYKNNKCPMQYRCKCGNVSMISLSGFKTGQRCSSCKGGVRYTLSYVQQYFLDHECELLDSYINALIPLKYKCKCGNEATIRFADFKRGKRCKECGKHRGVKNCNWNPDREAVRLNELLRRKSYKALRSSLEAFSTIKQDKIYKLLNYSVKQLKEHLETFPDWHFIKNQDWHLDHIFPIKAFVDYGISDLALINSLSNLQPLLKQDNLRKSKSYDKQQFEIWLKDRALP